MGVYKDANLPSVAKSVKINSISDERGLLCFSDNTELPFPVQRVFWISDVPQDQIRGGHAHRVCAEILFPLSGEFDVRVDDGNSSAVFHLSNPDEGLYIGPNVWCSVENFSSGAVCMVLASHLYQKEGYINDYNEFKKYIEAGF